MQKLKFSGAATSSRYAKWNVLKTCGSDYGFKNIYLLKGEIEKAHPLEGGETGEKTDLENLIKFLLKIWVMLYGRKWGGGWRVHEREKEKPLKRTQN